MAFLPFYESIIDSSINATYLDRPSWDRISIEVWSDRGDGLLSKAYHLTVDSAIKKGGQHALGGNQIAVSILTAPIPKYFHQGKYKFFWST